MDDIVKLVQQDKQRFKALECVRQLNLPDCYIAAGFVRNMVWDHNHSKLTPLNDVDVIYYDKNELSEALCFEYERRLQSMLPAFTWQVRNQARMHERNGDEQYSSSVDAMSYWPEKETAVALRVNGHDEIECTSAFGFDSLFENTITYNPKRNKEVFEQRVLSKEWFLTWPKLVVVA